MYQTGYDNYAPLDYMNDSNKTGFLKLKYKNMNQTEIPQMNFVNKKEKLNINKFENIDLDNMLRMNNIKPLKDISDELIFGEIRDEDFEEPNLPKLLKTYQYALEYLKAKSKKIKKTNEKLHIEYEQLINQSFEIEKKLENNKKEISENKTKKKEYEFLLLSYESLVNFNCNPIENTNIIMKNVKTNYGVDNYTEYEKNSGLGLRTYPKNARFYCHICNGKYFNSEIGLENHMKRRHLAQIRQNNQREKEEMKEEEIEDFCNKKIEETTNRFQNMLNQKYNILSRDNIKEEINMIKRDNDEKYKIMMENNKNNNEEMNLRLKELKMQQDEYNKNIINIVNAAKEKNDNNENRKVTIEYPQVNDLNKLINSIENIGDIIKQQKNKNDNINNEMLKEIKDKLDNMKIPPNQNSIKIDYNINNNMNKDINLIKTNNNIEDNLNNNNSKNNFDDNNKQNEPQNTLLHITKKDENNIDQNLNINSFAKDNNKIPNENNNNQINEENNNIIKDNDENNNINNNNINNNIPENKGEQKLNNKNNIISQNDFLPNTSLNHEQILDQEKKEEPIEIQREKKEENENEEKEINISQLQNNILESNIELIQNPIDINNSNLKNPNMLNQNNNNNKIDLPIIQEKANININDNKKIKESIIQEKERDFDINNEIKSDENNDNNNNNNNNSKNNNSSAQFGKTSEIINNDNNNKDNNNKLFDFAQEFMKRDQPILNKQNINLSDINGFSKEILEDKKFKNNLSKNMETFIEKNVENKNIENMNDLDKKSEGELLDIIKNTLNNINKINEKSNIAGMYFQTMNKMIDFKMVENEQKMMREAYNKKGELKSTRSNASKAKKIIENTENDLKRSEL